MNYMDIKNKLKDYDRSIIGAKNAMNAAILVPLVEVDGQLNLLFEVRSRNLNSQPGDISFPGGKIDQGDEGPLAAAIRETKEELGIPSENIEIITELDLFVSPYGLIIHNFLGKINDISKISPNSDEVEDILLVPVKFFLETKPVEFDGFLSMNREEFPYHLIPQGRDYEFKSARSKTLFWQYEGRTIWGFTASIVSNLLELLKM